MTRSVAVLILLFGLIASSHAQPQNASPMELMKLKRIGRVDVAPDGKRLVYAVREAVLEKGRSEYLSRVYVANEDGSDPKEINKGPYTTEDPQWSPDGKKIAFLTKRGGRRSLWWVPADLSDLRPLSHNTRADITSFKWAPDSKSIAYVAAEGPTPQEDKAKQEKNDARVLDENFKMNRLYHVTIPANNEQIERPLTDGTFHIPASGRSGFVWSPDSKSIVYTRTKTPLADHWTSADLQMVNVATGKSSALLAPGPVRYAPHFSPEGTKIAFVASPRSWAGAGIVHVYTLGEKNSKPLADTFDGFGRYSDIVGWSAAGDKIYFTEIKGTITQFGWLTLDNQVSVMSGFGVAAGGIHLNASRTRLGMSWETLREPAEASTCGVNDFKPVAASRVNANAGKLRLGDTTTISWKSKDGLEIEGLLTYPANYKAGQRYPLLVNVHGGPMGVFTQTFVAAPGLYPIATFSERGYAVLRPNPRGSSGYGKKFRYANYGDWGGGDYRDIMAGVDFVIGMGIADPDRLGIMGWSYGGFMTSWTITQTQRFKAASVGAGVTNLMSFTGTADIPSFLPDYFSGEFWDKFDAYRDHSAMFKIKGVKTPTLIQHGERDERVPLSQGLELYNALKRQGCPTRMVIYPRTPHSIDEPRLLVDCMERNLEWFDRYLAK